MNGDPKSREVITVQGPIRPEEMGVTYTHEHLFLDAMDHYSSYGYQLVIDDEDMMAQEILEFTTRGGRTICDVTLDEIGREAFEQLGRGGHCLGCFVRTSRDFARDTHESANPLI